MRSRGLYFILGGFLFVWILSVYFYHINAMASDLTGKIQMIAIDEDGYISLLEEDEKNTGILLSDSIGDIETLNEDYDNDNEYNDSNMDNGVDSTEYDNFKIMVIFCFGLVAGVIVGNYLSGFVK